MDQTKPKSKSLALWAASLGAVVAGASALSTMLGGPGLDEAQQQEIVSLGQRVLLAIDELTLAALAAAAAYGRLRATTRLK